MGTKYYNNETNQRSQSHSSFSLSINCSVRPSSPSYNPPFVDNNAYFETKQYNTAKKN